MITKIHQQENMQAGYTFDLKHFDNLSIHELYDIMSLRQSVFIVEQNCVYLDADFKDKASWHLMMLDDKHQIVGYARLLPEGISYQDYTSIGRVITSYETRNLGLGKILMAKAVEETIKLFGPTPIKIGAQAHLERFYNTFGFIREGDNYMEDGIPHTIMVRKNAEL
ncbi:MAG: GNAT family N-acetyltransferase [Saprospiraceae bacterium]|nr:GNAT family N-acetyltransferase [Saprospiraceae bacterium]